MTNRVLILVLLFLLGNILGYSQQGKLFFIRDKDTLSLADNNIKIFIETSNRLIPFNNNEKLLYPDTVNLDSINSIVVLYNNDTLSFYNFKVMSQFSNLPITVIKAQLPVYSSIFSDKRNMYFTVDTYPFENEDRLQTAIRNCKKGQLFKTVIVELYYQVTEIQLYELK